MTKLFQPFRSLGLITNGLPVDIQARGQKYFLTTVINSTFQIYDGEKLGLLFVGEEALGQIFSLCSYKDNTFVCTDTELLVYKRQKVQKRIKVQFQCDRLLVVGNILTLVGQKSIQLLGIDGLVGEKSIKDLELEAQVSNLCFNDDITALIHPSTYLNKILVAIGNSIELWNIDLYKKVHSFPEFPSMITTLVQSPALDTIAIGLLDGTVILYNLKIETQILKFQQQGPATCISFRTDGEHIMATSNNTGDVYLWDLGSKKLVYTMTSCHKGAINTCFFYHGMPLLLTSGGDNSIKQWLFDGQDKSPRLLKQRSGHESSPTKIQFMSPTTLLTSGLDSTVRFTSVVRDAQNTELSQGSLEHKSKKYGVEIEDLRLPNITQFAYNESKAREWDNLLTCHVGDTKARTWSTQRKAIGKHNFEAQDKSIIKSVQISACGNFGFIGTHSGLIEKYNMQSGLLRGATKAHISEVSCMVSDNVNLNFISGSLDGTVNIWDFNQFVLLKTIDLKSPITNMCIHQEAGIIAVVTDNLKISVIDIDTHKLVREFKGHTNRITGISFSPDGRWIVSSSLDQTIRTWDLPTGFLIDAFRVPDICTSVSMSPSGDFIATTHVNQLGIFLWSNKSLYSYVPLRPLSEKDVKELMLPTAGGTETHDIEVDESVVPDMDIDDVWQPLDQNLITLSTQPKSKWQNLLNLDTIKERNKPIEPPKAPEKAPFFLDTLPGQSTIFEATVDNEKTETKVIDWNNQQDSEFLQIIKQQNVQNFIQFLNDSQPSKLDVEIKLYPTSETDLLNFFTLIQLALETKQNYELLQSILQVFLRCNGDVLKTFDHEILTRVKNTCNDMAMRLESKLLYGLCLLDLCLSN